MNYRSFLSCSVTGSTELRRQRKTMESTSAHPPQPVLPSRLAKIQAGLTLLARQSLSILSPKTKTKTRLGVGSSRTRRSLGERFFRLPVEIQLQILNLVSLFDILNLRHSSRGFRQLTVDNESYLVNAYIRTSVPIYVLRLFPPSKKIPTLQYAVELVVKQKISTNLAHRLAEQVMKEMMGRQQRRNMEREMKERMLNRLRRGMAPLVLTLMHFFEMYTIRKLQRIGDGTQNDASSTLSSEKNMMLQSDIMSQYPDSMLLSLHQMFHLLLHLFFRRMTPSFPIVGTGRWPSRCPPGNSFAKVFVFGGIKGVWKLYRIKGDGKRRRALDKYVKAFDVERVQWRSRLGRFGTVIYGTTAMGSTSTSKASGLGSRPSTTKLAHLEVDDLLNLWTPAAEERLLAREIVQDLDEVGCCGRFVSLLLTGAQDDEDDEEEELDYEGDSDSEDDEEYQDSGETYGVMTGDYEESAWDNELANIIHTEDELPDY